MIKKILSTVVLSCSLVAAGQAFAAEKAFPTVVYRDFAGDEPDAKFELTYDSNGRITQAKEYRMQDAEYVLMSTRTFEYHCLPNGDFVMTKEETVFTDHFGLFGGHRRTSAYDANGMELFYQWENTKDAQTWELSSGMRAALNPQGIRTGIESYDNGSWVADTRYTFDSRGRTVNCGDEEEGVAYVWGEGLKDLISATMRVDGMVMVFSNFVPLKNMEYFNAYDLMPIIGGYSEDIADSGDELVPYVWDDYTLHLALIDMDVSAFGQTGAYTWTIDDNAGEWTQTLTFGGMEVEKTVLKKLANGGWKQTYTGAGDNMSIDSNEYDEFGALIRNYEYYHFVDEESREVDTYERETVYTRQYDGQGRPATVTKTTDGEVQYVETCTAWTDGHVSIADVLAAAPLSVYPNPTTGELKITNYELRNNGACPIVEHVEMYDMYGRMVGAYPRLLSEVEACGRPINGETTIDISHLPSGVYFLKMGNETAKVVKR